MKKAKIITAAILIVSTALTVIALITLPDTVIVQLSSSGNSSSTMHKVPAVLVPLALSAFGALGFYNDSKQERNVFKSLFVAFIGVASAVFMLIVNL